MSKSKIIILATVPYFFGFDICSHELSDFFYITVYSSQFNDPKIKIQKLKSHRSSSHLLSFSDIKESWETESEIKKK
jgi:hypothetical protein